MLYCIVFVYILMCWKILFFSPPLAPQEVGLQLVYAGQVNKLSSLTSRPEYAPLRPILLLLGWDVFPAKGSGKEFTEALWPSQVYTCMYTA